MHVGALVCGCGFWCCCDDEVMNVVGFDGLLLLSDEAQVQGRYGFDEEEALEYCAFPG